MPRGRGRRAVSVRRRRSVSRARVRGRRPRPTLSLAVIAGLVPGATGTFNVARAHGMEAGGKHFLKVYSGYDVTSNDWRLREMALGMFPLAAGVVLHRAATWFGINRMIARAGIPFVRI